MNKLVCRAGLLTLALLAGAAHAGFNKCVAADGSVTYQQTGCPQSAQVQTASVSMLGTGKVSLATQVDQSCKEWGNLTHSTGKALTLEVLTCTKNFYPLCDDTAMASVCREQLVELKQKVTVATASAAARKEAARAPTLAATATAVDLPPVSCRQAGQVIADATHGPNEVRVRCQQEMDQACAAGRDSDACKLFNNKLSMTVSGKQVENKLKASGEWEKGKNDLVGNLNDLWTACMGRAQFSGDNATFLRRKAECDGMAP